jgi:CRISPR-associated protein Cas2
MSAERVYLVSYDISNRRRWRRVFKLLKRVGEHQQLSVFLCRLPPRRMTRLEKRLSGLIDPQQDRLMVVAIGTVPDAVACISGPDAPTILLPVPAVIV